MIISKEAYSYSFAKYIFNGIFSLAFLVVFLFTSFGAIHVAEAKIPPQSFAKKRLLKTRVPGSYQVELRVLAKTITKYQGTSELFSGDFSIQKLLFSSRSKSVAHQLLAIALGEQHIVETLEKKFGGLGKEMRVGVAHDQLVHCYGDLPRVCVNRKKGSLSSFRIFKNGSKWKLVYSQTGNRIQGAIYQSGLVVLRFDAKKI